MRVMPDCPSRMLDHACVMPTPTGETIPRPVTTTLRLAKIAPLGGRGSGFSVGLDVIDRLLDRGNFHGFLVRYFSLEFFLEGHDELHGIERIGAEVVHEGRI